MKALLLKYKLVIKFIVTFLVVYSILSVGYKLYLDYSTGSKYYPDYITNLVAKQSKVFLESFNYNAEISPHSEELSMKVFVNDKYVARVIEGCNAISVIILFIAFVIAFSGTFKNTFLFILAGSALIYTINIFRIAILSIGLYHYPWRQDVLHTVIFPLIIYGTVFLLWMFWVNHFTKKHKNNV